MRERYLPVGKRVIYMSRMRDEEAMEIFKKYDKNLYDYYMTNARGFGIQTLMYAEYLKNLKCDKEVN